MAEGRRRQVAPVRKLVAAVLATFATFVILFGAGMRSWAIAVLGVALLALAIGLVAITAVRSGPRAWVTGIGHVHSVTEPPASSTFGRCELQIVIDAPGVPARSVKIRDPRVPVSKWPDPGATLPIMVAIDDQRHVRILWDEVLTHAEAAAAGDLPPPFDDLDPLGDDILIEQETPPWARGGRDDPYAAGPTGAPVSNEDLAEDLDALRDDLETLRDDLGTPREDPVVMRQTPGGTIVLEGTLVDPPSTAPLPRRSRPGPGPGGRTRRPSPSPAGRSTDVPFTTTVTDAPAPDAPAPDARVSGDAGFDAPPSDLPPADPPPSDPPPSAVSGTTGPADPDLDPETPPGGSDRTAEQPQDEIDIPLDDPGTGTGRQGPSDPLDDAPASPDDEAILADLIATQPSARVGGSGPIAGVGITLLVTNLDRSITFYRDLLGFFEIDGGDGNAILASGATRLVLRAIRDVAPINRRLVHLNLEVNDVNAVYEELLAKGVKFTYAPRAVNRGAKLELWAAAFRDPDGHGIALTQWRGRSTG
ncbi:VOC family protein [Plantactinospora sp. S1510]|uniref:VOC family protein n=1 Tax=Plantactinospora alkalitolerans TaxID=2789879 RepID=A0ABS0H1N8_9ACTN|nr:VOC family protein [Plantactinospora alkalitolerans]MBF9132378.1 VOC family protein [Plantactinospora alkalitolerans]